jgi:hypothetical protein
MMPSRAPIGSATTACRPVRIVAGPILTVAPSPVTRTAAASQPATPKYVLAFMLENARQVSGPGFDQAEAGEHRTDLRPHPRRVRPG